MSATGIAVCPRCRQRCRFVHIADGDWECQGCGWLVVAMRSRYAEPVGDLEWMRHGVEHPDWTERDLRVQP